MAIEASTIEQQWVQYLDLMKWYRDSFPFVSANRMQKDGKIFTLKDAYELGRNEDARSAFNIEASECDIHIEESDSEFPMKIMIKYSIFLAKMDNDDSFIPTNEQYVKMALNVAAGKNKNEEPLAEFHQTLMTGSWDATREILDFKEKIESGKDKGKYIAERLVFNENAELENMGKIIVAPEGWTSILGAEHRYPLETSKNICTIENIETPAPEGADVKGYWYVGSDPVGEQRLALRLPCRGDEGLLHAGVLEERSCSGGWVAALRLRGAKPEDYVAQIRNLKTEAERMQDGLASVQEEMRKLSARINALFS